MNRLGTSAVGAALVLGWVARSEAVIFLETADPQFHTTTPGDNSGWQYEGKFLSYFMGVPIAPYFFITAKHFGGGVGSVFDFHGDSYTTIAIHDNPATDLRIWEVNHAKPFPDYAPLSSGTADIGGIATVIGRGTRRGAAVVVSGEAKGWAWGPDDNVERWGRNKVVASVSGGPSYGDLLYCDFDNPGIAGECQLSTGDSGGGMFVLEDGLWRLAAINFSVDGPFRTGPAGPAFNAALYDAGGLEYQKSSNPDVWEAIPEQSADIQSSLYGSRISPLLAWIQGIAPEAGSLAPESYNSWQRLYFTPAQIALPTVSGPLADCDGDGINNLLEFALNLDPTFDGRATIESNTGVAGLPAVYSANHAGSDRLTIEFVRRTSGSGAGLTYIPEFSSDLVNWQAAGTESVTAINPRWDRVKAADSLTTMEAPRRYARLRVAVAE